MTADDLPVPRIVLDTNVCLDLFLFRDPACKPLLAALQAGTVQAVTRADCRAEWLRVLHYPQLPIQEATRPGIAAAFDRLIHDLPDTTVATDETLLPRCADPDDQKFLELARHCRADFLVTKDRDLLVFARPREPQLTPATKSRSSPPTSPERANASGRVV